MAATDHETDNCCASVHVLQADLTVLATKNVQLGLLSSTSDDLFEDP